MQFCAFNFKFNSRHLKLTYGADIMIATKVVGGAFLFSLILCRKVLKEPFDGFPFGISFNMVLKVSYFITFGNYLIEVLNSNLSIVKHPYYLTRGF